VVVDAGAVGAAAVAGAAVVLLVLLAAVDDAVAAGTGTRVARFEPPADRFTDSHCVRSSLCAASNGRMTTETIPGATRVIRCHGCESRIDPIDRAEQQRDVGAMPKRVAVSRPLRGRIATFASLTVLAAAALSLRRAGIAFTGPRYFWLAPLGFGALAVFGIGLTAYCYLSVRYLRGIHKLVAEHKYLAHWTYGDDEWLKFARKDWFLTKREIWKLPVKYTLLGLVVGAVAGFVGKISSEMTWRTSLTGPLFLAAGGFVISVLDMSLSSMAGLLRYRKRLERTGEFYVGREGVYESGACSRYVTCKSAYSTLRAFKIEPGEPALVHLSIEVKTGSRMGGGTDRTIHVRLPVPHGHEQEAQQLQHQFRVPEEWSHALELEAAGKWLFSLIDKK
jgi:hypothetical protein